MGDHHDVALHRRSAAVGDIEKRRDRARRAGKIPAGTDIEVAEVEVAGRGGNACGARVDEHRELTREAVAELTGEATTGLCGAR